jgi:hypothetical protein
MMNAEFKPPNHQQISRMNADFKPVEFDQFGIAHHSKFITHHSPQASEVLGYGE